MKPVRIFWKRNAILFCCLIISVWFIYNKTYRSSVRNELNRGLSNPGDIRYLINNKHICNDYKRVFCIILVSSDITHFNRRVELRSTWLKSNNYRPKNIQVVYLTGKINDKNVQNKLMLESQTYSDIIQGDFIDSYQNSTYKGVLGFKWVAEHCRNSDIVIKTHDNVIINLFLFFDKFAMHMNDRELLGKYIRSNEIVREKNSQYYVPTRYLKGMIYYPLSYLSGLAVILPGNLIPLYYNASITSEYFPIEDYFLFGILTAKINRDFNETGKLKYRDLTKFITSDERYWKHCYLTLKGNCNLLIAYQEQYRLDTESVWNVIIQNRSQSASGHFDMA